VDLKEVEVEPLVGVTVDCTEEDVPVMIGDEVEEVGIGQAKS